MPIQGQINDGWLDNIDWMAVKEQQSASKQKEAKSGDEDDDDLNRCIDVVATYRKMLEFMKAGESVLKGRERIGVHF